jgi:hypothetical protein
MLNAVIRFSLRYRMLIVVLSLTLLVYGGYLATTMPIDAVFPDLDWPELSSSPRSRSGTEEVEHCDSADRDRLARGGWRASRAQPNDGRPQRDLH